MAEQKTDRSSRDERNSDSGGEQLHAGVAYQVFVMQSNGQRRSVDPSTRVFNSGEQFEVDYRPNFPGTIEVFNIDPSGKEERIDRVVLEAAQLGKLGPYQFVGAKGKDTLRIVLYPCLGKPPSGDTGQTRGIARVQIRPEIARALQGCDDRSQQQAGPTRGIAKVSRDGDTAFALDPVSRREIESGKLAPREIRIVFSHQ